MSLLQDRIKERRTELNLTLLEVANKLGVTEATVQRYESGEIKNIKHDMIVKIATILKCSPQYIMGWSNYVTEPASYNSINGDVTLSNIALGENNIINSENNGNQEMLLEFSRILKELAPKDKITLMNMVYEFEEKHKK